MKNYLYQRIVLINPPPLFPKFLGGVSSTFFSIPQKIFRLRRAKNKVICSFSVEISDLKFLIRRNFCAQAQEILLQGSFPPAFALLSYLQKFLHRQIESSCAENSANRTIKVVPYCFLSVTIIKNQGKKHKAVPFNTNPPS